MNCLFQGWFRKLLYVQDIYTFGIPVADYLIETNVAGYPQCGNLNTIETTLRKIPQSLHLPVRRDCGK